MSNMRHDVKIRRLISKHGANGYAVYNFILEAITEHMETDTPIPELEETAQDMAEYLKMDTVNVEEIMLCCMENGLFDQDEITGRILCPKIYKFLDKASTGSAMLREMITNYQSIRINQENPDIIRKIPEKAESEQNRTEQNRVIDKPARTTFSPPSSEEVKAYCNERGNGINSEHFIDYYATRGWMAGKAKMKDWKAAVRTWEKNEKKDGRKPVREVVNALADANIN